MNRTAHRLTAYRLAICLIFLALACLSASAQVGADRRPTPTPTPRRRANPPRPTPTPRANTGGNRTTTRRTNNQPRGGGDAASDRTFWESIRNSTDVEDFRAYLEQYPAGQFVALARNRIRQIEAGRAASGTTTTSASPPRRSAGSRAPFTNQSGIEFVYVPAGSFTMGSQSSDDEKPAHQVNISNGFYMGKYEVTQGQWQAVMGSNPSNFKGDNLPVEKVTWNDAQEFIRKLNARGDGYTYRLPSEAEWEYACRAGTSGDYAGSLDAMAWHDGNSNGTTHPVGSKQPNSFGLFDMHGNVWEWCEDWHHDTYAGAPSDGSAWLSGREERVLRGGSWSNNAANARSANRNSGDRGSHDINVGFRVVAVSRT